jgi:hypothetical protein
MDLTPLFPSKPLLNDFDFADFTESSPALSLASSRKRGICESPFDDFDDCSSAGGFPLSQGSNKSSRLLSHPPTRLSEFSLHFADEKEGRISDFPLNSLGEKKKRATEIASDDGESSEQETVDGDDSGDDASVESVGDRRSPMPSFVPYSRVQQQQSSVRKSVDIYFGSPKLLEPTTAQVSDVIDSMSSCQDLKFLTRSLRKENGGSRQSWHVAPPVSWIATRRSSFFCWTTRSLGFTFRAGGMSVSYIQISKTRGASLLELLDSALSECKERGIGTKTPNNARGDEQHFNFAGVQGMQRASAAKALTLTPKE